eukprot:7835-Pyramimonas_sp.AAC.1
MVPSPLLSTLTFSVYTTLFVDSSGTTTASEGPLSLFAFAAVVVPSVQHLRCRNTCDSPKHAIQPPAGNARKTAAAPSSSASCVCKVS